MSSELHELIQKEIAAAELRIDAAGSVGTYHRGALRFEGAGRRARRDCCDSTLCDSVRNWGPVQRGLLYWEVMPRGKKIAIFVVLVCFVMMISIATAPGGHYGDKFGSADTQPGSLHYVRIHQGMDPEALPSLAILGVAKSGVTDLYRRIQLRYPNIHAGQFKELNFLTECQINSTGQSQYKAMNAHCGRVNSGDPQCHECSVSGYSQMFNTTDVRRAMGSCTFPVTEQMACAGGHLQPDGSRAEAAEGYSPVFTMDASKMYSGSVGLALRSADLLKQLSPTTRLILMLRNPADLGRAIYNARLSENCGSHECDGKNGATYAPPYQLVLDREMQFLNESEHGMHLLQRLSSSVFPGEARVLEQHLQGNWTEFAVRKGWPAELWGKVLYSLKGIYHPLIMTWVERFVVPGRPLLVIQAEGYFQKAPDLVDNVLGPFLFGDPTGLAAFQRGPAPEPVVKRKYGMKAVQTVSSRCALHDLYKPLNALLEKLLNEYTKQGKIQLVRAQREGPLWSRPADCKTERATDANYTASNEDYDYQQASTSSSEYSPDYDYGYDFEGGDYGDYVAKSGAPRDRAPPGRIFGRRLG